ncbi:hypothetical protein SLS53_007154 [Cytospora paraplurivora]|uniref:aldehyde dehydrogenase (NAD(+)) n=1 Tax=Cytospora paraplurivora TaxID=2898453 RepID=A0AAN9YE76_9PEZI
MDPSTGSVFTYCHSASIEDVNHTVQLAHDAYKAGVWSRLPRHTRADILEKAASLLTAHMLALIRLEVQQTGRAFQYYAALLRTEERSVLPTQGKLHNWVDRVPLGVVVQITPFNHPLLIAVKKIAPALAAGNSVIVKPSELTPLTTLRLGEILAEAGVPDGVFNVLPGYGATTGAALCSHPLVKKVDITGGTAAGQAIGSVVGANLAKFTAELGGKAPLVVFKEAEINVAVNGIAFGAFIASGQTCVAATRIIVENSVMDTVLEKLVAKAESITLRMGAPTHPESTIGPLVSARQLSNVQTLVDQAVSSGDAIPVFGGFRLQGKSKLDGTDFAKGYFFAPTVLRSKVGKSILETKLWREEAFGPVVVVVGFDTEEEAISLANDSDFGLGAAVWTQSLSQAYRVSEQIDAGIVWVNTHHRNDPSSPWGGAKSASGVGSENGIDAYHAYTTTKSVIINYASPEESLRSDDWFREDGESVRYG